MHETLETEKKRLKIQTMIKIIFNVEVKFLTFITGFVCFVFKSNEPTSG